MSEEKPNPFGLTNKDLSQIHSIVDEACSWDDLYPAFYKLLEKFESDLQKRMKQKKARKKLTVQKKSAPYIKAGLAEPFAEALVVSPQPEEILNLWEATWWKQYDPTDLIVTCVLDGTLTEAQARRINEFRGEHPELAMACMKQKITVEWAQMLLESGFDEYPMAVQNVLDGADPILIARIRCMEVNNVPSGCGPVLDELELT